MKSRLKPDAVSGLQYQDKLIALPWTLAPAGFWYNKALMAKFAAERAPFEGKMRIDRFFGEVDFSVDK